MKNRTDATAPDTHETCADETIVAHPLVRALVRALAREIAHEIRGQDDTSYYTTAENPLGARAFRDAARRGAFPSFVVRRMITARKSDVHAYMERRQAPARKPSVVKAKAPTTDEEMLAELGLKPTRRAG